MQTESVPFSGPLFVVGLPRSGTKLLRGLLNAHPKIGIPLNETEFLPYLERHWPQFGDLSRRDRFDAFYQWISGTFYFQNRLREHGTKIDLPSWYLACDGDFSLPNVFEQLLRHDAKVSVLGIWGDKSPSYVNCIPLLKRVFPQAKVIHIIRDVRDYVLSMEKAFGKDRLRAAQRWVQSIERARQAKQTFPQDVLEVYYEALLADPETELRRICTFLGINFDAGMLQLKKTTENLGSTAGHVGIVSQNTEKYKREMSPQQRESVEMIAKEVLGLLQYPCAYTGAIRKLSPLEMRSRQIRDAVSLITTDARRNGWRTTIRSRVGHFISLRM